MELEKNLLPVAPALSAAVGTVSIFRRGTSLPWHAFHLHLLAVLVEIGLLSTGYFDSQDERCGTSQLMGANEVVWLLTASFFLSFWDVWFLFICAGAGFTSGAYAELSAASAPLFSAMSISVGASTLQVARACAVAALLGSHRRPLRRTLRALIVGYFAASVLAILWRRPHLPNAACHLPAVAADASRLRADVVASGAWLLCRSGSGLCDAQQQLLSRLELEPARPRRQRVLLTLNQLRALISTYRLPRIDDVEFSIFDQNRDPRLSTERIEDGGAPADKQSEPTVSPSRRDDATDTGPPGAKGLNAPRRLTPRATDGAQATVNAAPADDALPPPVSRASQSSAAPLGFAHSAADWLASLSRGVAGQMRRLRPFARVVWDRFKAPNWRDSFSEVSIALQRAGPDAAAAAGGSAPEDGKIDVSAITTGDVLERLQRETSTRSPFLHDEPSLFGDLDLLGGDEPPPQNEPFGPQIFEKDGDENREGPAPGRDAASGSPSLWIANCSVGFEKTAERTMVAGAVTCSPPGFETAFFVSATMLGLPLWVFPKRSLLLRGVISPHLLANLVRENN